MKNSEFRIQKSESKIRGVGTAAGGSFPILNSGYSNSEFFGRDSEFWLLDSKGLYGR